MNSSIENSPASSDEAKKNPTISVLMSVHNGAAWLKESIDSILGQTFGDFEFIIVDDGSKDETPRILKEYESRDSRIILVRNETNIGLMRSLNKGLDQSKGLYIARMDSDDISLPNRFQKQIRWFEDHPSASVVSALVRRVDVQGRHQGFWMDDLTLTNAAAIKRALPFRNCIAHPSVMIRSDVLKKFRYNERVSVYEDYELWMRIASAGYEFHKVPEVLLDYRLHGESMMSSSWKANPARVEMKMKREFLLDALKHGKLGGFERKVILSLATSVKTWIKLKLPRKFKKGVNGAKEYFALLTRPALRIGTPPGTAVSAKKKIMLVMSSVRAGEKEQLFLKVARALSEHDELHLVATGNADPFLLKQDYGPICESITAPPKNLELRSSFNICSYLDRAINLNHIDAILIGNGDPGYYWLSKIQQRGSVPPAIDILRDVESEFDHPRFKWVWPLMNLRICTSRKIVDKMSAVYRAEQRPELIDRLRLVRDGIEYQNEVSGAPGSLPPDFKKRSDAILWLGQFSIKGDPLLFIEFAAELRSRVGDSASFVMVGDGPLTDITLRAARQMGVADALTLTGRLNSEQIRSILREARILVMTSMDERAPTAVLEAFAAGVPVVSTATGALDEMIEDSHNGRLLAAQRDFPVKAAEWIQDLMNQPEKYEAVREAALATDRCDLKSTVAGTISVLNEAMHDSNRIDQK